jgi:hypothetical protein
MKGGDDPHEPIKQKQIHMYQKINKIKPPSREKRLYWVYSVFGSKGYPESTSNSGKWLMFPSFREVDSIWLQVDQLTKAGRLGDAAKVSTKQARRMKKSSHHAICVYTYDKTDYADSERIRKELSRITDLPLFYKLNKSTMKE